MMSRPFHFSFLVSDLAEARSFYGTVLGCPEGRSTASWIDYDFFGNQISVHRSSELPPTFDVGRVDDITVPMPHFGAILDWKSFDVLAERITQANVRFVIAPLIRFEGKSGEQRTMFLRDPSGNALEFKAFRDEAQIFAT